VILQLLKTVLAVSSFFHIIGSLPVSAIFV